MIVGQVRLSLLHIQEKLDNLCEQIYFLIYMECGCVQNLCVVAAEIRKILIDWQRKIFFCHFVMKGGVSGVSS